MLPLLHQDLIVAPLSSGSRGNCTYVGTDRVGVLVDCGLGPTQTHRRMDAIGLRDARIAAVLVTHEHADHVGGAAVLDRSLERRYGDLVPFYFTAGTWIGVKHACRPRRVVTVIPGQKFKVDRFTIEPVAVPHDVPEPVCYTVDHCGLRAAVITDLGRSTRLVERQLATVDLAVVEFNHDTERLLDGPYPWHLKQRIRGNHGHLSNDQAAELVANGASPRLKKLLLAHLSEENNRPELAWDAACRGLAQAGVAAEIAVALQREALPVSRVAGEAPALIEPRVKPRERLAVEPAHRSGQMGLFEMAELI